MVIRNRSKPAAVNKLLPVHFKEEQRYTFLWNDGTIRVYYSPEEAEPDALACPGFPEAHRRRIRTNNVQERCNREIEGRSRAVQVFPSATSLIRLAGAVRAGIDEDRSARRCFQPGSLAQIGEEKIVTAPKEPDPDLKEKAARIVQVAMESARNSRRRAA